ncbi:hypothetical protein P7C70_g4372, partial [Phenoliferia sp. Uapishka_3]
MAPTAANKGRKLALEKSEDVKAAREQDDVVASRYVLHGTSLFKMSEMLFFPFSSAKKLQAAQMAKAPPPHSHGTRASSRSSADALTPNPPPAGSLADILAQSKAKATSGETNTRGRWKGKKEDLRDEGKSAEEPDNGDVNEQDAERETEVVDIVPGELQDALDADAGLLAEELDVSAHGIGKSVKMASATAPPPQTLLSHLDALKAPETGSLLSVTLVVESQNDNTNVPNFSDQQPMTVQVRLPVVALENGDPQAPVFSVTVALAKLRIRNATALRIQDFEEAPGLYNPVDTPQNLEEQTALFPILPPLGGRLKV